MKETLQQVLERVYPTEPTDWVNYVHKQGYHGYDAYLLPHNAGMLKKMEAKLIPVTNDKSTLTFRVGNNATNILNMNIKFTESCCAMAFLYGFTISEQMLTPEQFKALMDQFLAETSIQGRINWVNRRLIVNMVEVGRPVHDPLEKVTPSENPQILYKMLYDYFYKNAAMVNVMLMPNANTGKIIHHMEVVFAKDYFNEFYGDDEESEDDDF